MDFAGKRVLVTGASRGIGRAAAEAFRAGSARVALGGRSAAAVERAIDELGGGADLVAAPGDLRGAADCAGVVAAAVSGLGGLDVLVNSAGVCDFASIEESDEALWDRGLDINLKGTFFCSRAALPSLRQSGGAIVNLASDAGLFGSANLSVYCAAKGGVVNLTRAMAYELAPQVRVNCVCPGYTDTDMVRRDYFEAADDPEACEQEARDYAPMKRIARPQEIAAAILYLASDAAGFVTGTALSIDGGSSAGR